MPDRNAFNELMRSLTSSDANITLQPEHEEWDAMIQRIHAIGQIHTITEETYWYFLEVLLPKNMERGHFAFAEGQEELTIFWEREGKSFCRRLTQEETDRYCETSGLSKCFGM